MSYESKGQQMKLKYVMGCLLELGSEHDAQT
jgi:hypothetical protein